MLGPLLLRLLFLVATNLTVPVTVAKPAKPAASLAAAFATPLVATGDVGARVAARCITLTALGAADAARVAAA